MRPERLLPAKAIGSSRPEPDFVDAWLPAILLTFSDTLV
jgi:hypothetical protein